MKVISLGWGVQSFTLAAMVALGELEPVDAAIHADTGHEFSGTYAFAARWTPWLEQRGIRVVTVKSKDVGPIDAHKGVMIPALGAAGGMFKRQCTDSWKRAPMRRWLQANRNGQPIEQWLGISLDEFQRMKDSDVKYISHRWPLIEKKMTRADCAKWLTEHNLEVPPRSACTFCPYHNTAEWRHIKASPADWQEAVSVDRAIRKARPPYDLYVHPARKPLEDVDLRTPQEMGQLDLWDSECSGICGV